ncbi:MAG TPA: LacI family transcriptional regulator, partial [Anaerolineae bacterium]|nr:LacI family transcriptional regulator [Anaerolineae bacterium]
KSLTCGILETIQLRDEGGESVAVTIKDVARRAGVSVGTVSNVLNGTVTVRPATREQVLRAIAELDYHPTAAARSLKRQRTNTIGMIRALEGEQRAAFEASDYVFLEFLAGIGDEAAAHGVGILLLASRSAQEERAFYQQLVRSRQVDGLILLGTRLYDERIAYLVKQKVPFVTFGRSATAEGFAYVDVDGRQGIMDAVAHLVELGHRRIGCIEASAALTCTHDRREGFLAALAAHELPKDEALICPGDFTRESGYENMLRLLDLSDPPTAVLAPNDLAAFGAIQAAQSRGLVVGQDVSVVGFDDIPLAAHWQPPLTTIHQPTRQIGALACRMLLTLVAGKELEEPHVIFHPQLRV